MNYRTLGNSGVTVSELCAGTLIFGALQAQMTPEESIPVIRRALDGGVTFFDTAKTYGTYEHLRQGLAGASDIVIASKSPVKTAADIRRDVEDCLVRLDRERIDIFLMHVVRDTGDFADRSGALEALVRCREEGLVGHIGLSAHSVAGTRCALASPDIEIVMPILNRKGLGIPDGSREDMLAACREIKSTDRGLYDMKALAGGHLIGDIPAAIGYVRELGLFDAVAVGMKTAEEAAAITGIFNGTPGAETRALDMGRERAGRKKLIVYDFLCKKCGACVEGCPQGALTMGDDMPVADESKCILCGYCGESCPQFAIRVI